MATTIIPTNHMARKKPVEQKYQPNSYRVISQEAETWQRPEPNLSYTAAVKSNVIGQSEKYVPIFQHRKNRPNPNHVGFLRQDVRLLNEPVCDVYTDSSQAEQWDWWPSRTSDKPLKKPEHTLDSTAREDYQYRGSGLQGSNRHTANPNKTPANGIAPVNLMRERDGKQRVWKEGISYEHQYNSRLDPQYPIRGKRHGAFVWDRFSQEDVERMLNHFGIATENDQPSRAESCKEKTPGIAKIKPQSKPNTPPKSSAVKTSAPQSPTKTSAPQSPMSKSATTTKTAPPKSADRGVVTSPKASEPSMMEVTVGKPLSRSKTESILSMASQQRGSSGQLKLPPIAL